ncbi:YqzE family protein [Sporolactobacillus sp. THM7-7]|nr:YqzE family protein [Sporolactobacillus sp. THM7-7]
MKSDEYVKFLTEKFVRYMQVPREERRKARREQRAARPALRNQLFGQIPDAIENYAAQIRARFKKNP